MSFVQRVVRAARPATDLLPLWSFNRMGFRWNRQGFDLDQNDQRQEGRVALVTGSNSGIGRATALELARRGLDVWMLCRDRERGAEARDAIARDSGNDGVHLQVVDMSSLRTIRRFVQDFPLQRVDVLIHNAGVLPDKKQLTDDGVELTFATNVLGPFALTALLMKRLSSSSDARVVFVASGGLYFQRLDLALLDVEANHFDGTKAYANAKRAQVVLGHVLADRFGSEGRTTFASMHPGWVDTVALRNSLPRFHSAMKPFLRTSEEGADTAVWLATSDQVTGSRGRFWFDRRVAPEYPVPFTRETPAERAQLFTLCEQLSGATFEAVGGQVA